jgi:hypothetical protein
MRYGKERSP